MAAKKSLPRQECPGLGPEKVLFTRENVQPLAAELGVSDEQKICELLEQLTVIARWHECGEIFDGTDLPLVRKRLSLLAKKAAALLAQIDDLDHSTKDAFAMGFRRCRSDPRVRHLDSRFVTGAWLMIGAVRNVIDLVHDSAQLAVKGTPKGDGRPSNKSLNQTVLELARVYEDFSGKFTREKGRGVWTDSADWVAKVCRMLTLTDVSQPTDTELDTAMRYAVRALKDGHGPDIPWISEDFANPRDLQEPDT